ncbi:2-oxo-4-hydroxy-4-carboxy-5-ureidoimidazoline decarboxylase [Pseudonocardia sp.]|uniref:2-oxo-4-hydroxy-4-carboxy-5-ureidoimidazoline decarboxylase n=1 Tax=Pseudonocardia sp. TaxID=60912 RepID=UPI003D149189
MLVSTFDTLPEDEVRVVLAQVCSSPQWVRRLVLSRPHATRATLVARSDAALADLPEDEIDRALAGHPRIGERSGHASSRREQAGVAAADPQVLAALAEGNRAYEDRFGHVYLVCANGRPAEELLAVLRARLSNDPAAERRVLREELRRINRLRLEHLLEDA